MKKFKLLYLLTALIATAFATSCTESEFAAGEAGKGTEVYFSNENNSSFSLSDEDTSFDLVLNRINGEEEQTVSVLSDIAAESASMFTIPSSVTFKAGENSAKLTISVDVASLEDDTDYNIELLINDEDNSTPYGPSSMSITVIRWPWKLVGVGKLRDDFFSSMFDWNLFVEVDVNIHEHKSQKGIYMLEQPWGPNMLGELLGATAQEVEDAGFCRPANVIINCTDPNDVFFPLQDVGVNVNDEYGWIMIGTIEGGTLENGVITFPVDGLAMRLPDYNNVGANFKVNSSGMFRILFPDAEVVDYSLTANYSGMMVEADGETASAVIDFTYGADVTGINYVVTAGNLSATELDALTASLIAGTAENINEIKDLKEGGTISEKFALEFSGVYTVAAVALDKEGKPTEKGISTTGFFFPGMGGATAPECDLEILLGPVSKYWPEMSGECPDESSLYYEIDGSEFAELKTGLWQTDIVTNSGMTPEMIVEGYGTDASKPNASGKSTMDYVNENGFYGSAYINLAADTSYTFIVKATNIYGKSAVKVATYSTVAENFDGYEGELAVGKYYMACTPSLSTFENTFTIKPAKDENGNYSTTDYFITDLGLDDNGLTTWYAEYNSATSKFIVNGIELGYETYGNQFGKVYGYWDSGKTSIYGFMSWSPDNLDGDGSDPCVFSVDPTTKKIVLLETKLTVPVQTNDEAQSLLGYEGFFNAGTPVTYVNDMEAAATSSVKSGALKRSKLASTAKPAKKFKAEREIATLKVNAQVCEPLQKKTGRTTVNKSAACLNALK